VFSLNLVQKAQIYRATATEAEETFSEKLLYNFEGSPVDFGAYSFEITVAVVVLAGVALGYVIRRHCCRRKKVEKFE
jgi:hypothetical protein